MEMNEIFNEIFSSKTKEKKDAVISFTRYLITYPLDYSNFNIYQKIFLLNYPETAGIIFFQRDPLSFFSTLKPTHDIISKSLEVLVVFKPAVLNFNFFLAIIGIFQNNYKDPDYGNSIYRLSISDLQNIGKYFVIKNDDSDKILENIFDLVAFSGTKTDNELKIFSQKVLSCHYDKTKKLEDVIPRTILY